MPHNRSEAKVNQLRGHPLLELAKSLAPQETWIDVKNDDKKKFQKQVVKTTPQASDDFKLLMAMSRKMFGTRIFEITLNVPFVKSNIITTGVFKGIFAIDASGTGEWNAISGLFEEYKIESGWFEFFYNAPAVSGGTGNASDPSAAYLQVAYDPLNATVPPTSGLALTSHDQRQAYATGQTTQASTVQEVPVNDRGKLFNFKYKVPKGVLLNPNLSGQGSWVSVAAPVPFGGIEMYHQTANAGAIQVMAGTVYMRCKFRNRF